MNTVGLDTTPTSSESGFNKNLLRYVYPRSTEIAAVSAFAAWYIPRMLNIYFPGFLAGAAHVEPKTWTDTVWNVGNVIASGFWVPEATEAVSIKVRAVTFLASSFTLNMIAEAFFAIKNLKKDFSVMSAPPRALEPERKTPEKPKEVEAITIEKDLPQKSRRPVQQLLKDGFRSFSLRV